MGQGVGDPILPMMAYPAFAWSVQGDNRLHQVLLSVTLMTDLLHRGHVRVGAWVQHLPGASRLPGGLTTLSFCKGSPPALQRLQE